MNTSLIPLPLLIIVSAVSILWLLTGNNTDDTRHRNLYEWQSATPYNDPDNLCGGYPGITGYRATIGCTGYVYCNNGFLMGGGSGYEAVNSVIKCHAGMLFDESLGACSSTMKSCPTGGSSSSGSSPSTTTSVSKPKPSPILTTRRPTDKPIQQYYPNPPTRQPLESDIPPPPVPNPGAPSSARPPNGQAAAAIVESATSSNTEVVDNEGEDWSQQQQVAVSTTTTTTTPQPTFKQPASIMDWIPAAPSPPASQSTTSTNNSNNDKNNRCTSNNDCLSYNNSPYNICNQPNPLEAGYCGQCLTFNGMGCSTSEICQSPSMIQTSTQSESLLVGNGVGGGGGGGKCRSYNGFGINHEVGITKCFTKSTLDYDCQVILNDVEATCNVNLMICEGTAHNTESSVVYNQQQQQQQQQTVDGSSSVAAGAMIPPPPPLISPSTKQPTPRPTTKSPSSEPPPSPTTKEPTPLPSPALTTSNPQPISSPVVVPIPTEMIFDKEESSVASSSSSSSSSAQPTLSFLSAIMASSTTTSSQQQTEQIISASQESQTSVVIASQQTEQQPPPPVVAIPETSPDAIFNEEEPTTMIVCNLCGTDTTTTTVLNPSQVVSLDGNAYMKCEELTQIFTSQSIVEGSTRCLNFRGQFYNPCCIEVVGGASSAVSKAAEEDDDVGDDISYDKCNLCGDPNYNTINSGGVVFFMGEEIACDELDNRMYTDIRFDSSDCKVAQRSYSGTCCTSLDGTFNDNNNNNMNKYSPVGTPPTPSPHSSTSSTTAKPHYLSNWNTNVIRSTASRTCLASFILSICLPVTVGIVI